MMEARLRWECLRRRSDYRNDYASAFKGDKKTKLRIHKKYRIASLLDPDREYEDWYLDLAIQPHELGVTILDSDDAHTLRLDVDLSVPQDATLEAIRVLVMLSYQSWKLSREASRRKPSATAIEAAFRVWDLKEAGQTYGQIVGKLKIARSTAQSRYEMIDKMINGG